MHPVLFEVPTPWGGQYIYSYGVMLGLSLVMGWHFVMFFGKQKEGLERDLLANCYLITAVSAIVGGRLLYILTNMEAFDSPLKWFNLRTGGMVAYGGFLGGAVGAAIYLRRRNVPFLAFADAAAPALAAGLACTRVGCYLYGCDFGKRLSEQAPGWLKALGTFPRWDQFSGRLHGSPAFSRHVQVHYLPQDAAHSFPVHPTQLYAVAAGLLLLVLTLVVWKRRQFRGQVILVLTMAYGAWRFVVEYWRDDPERGEAFGFSTSQLISMALIPVAASFYVFMRNKARDAGLGTQTATATNGNRSAATHRSRKKQEPNG